MISIIVPNFNHESFLKQRIDSILAQTFKDFELIILDDASTDNSREIIELYRYNPKVSHIVYNQKNSGSTFYQWNKGLMLSSGEYIWIAESDDYAAPDFLSTCVHVLKETLGLKIVFTDSCVIDEQNGIMHNNLDFWYDDLMTEKWKHSYIQLGRKEIMEGLSIKNTIPNASAVVFKKVWFNEILSYTYCGDWLFWIKLLEADDKICFVKQSLNYFRSHENTTRYSTNSLKKARTYLKERAQILFYLKKMNLIRPENFEKISNQIINDWRNHFKIFDVFSGQFYIPMGNPKYIVEFLFYKMVNGLKKLKHLMNNSQY